MNHVRAGRKYTPEQKKELERQRKKVFYQKHKERLKAKWNANRINRTQKELAKKLEAKFNPEWELDFKLGFYEAITLLQEGL